MYAPLGGGLLFCSVIYMHSARLGFMTSQLITPFACFLRSRFSWPRTTSQATPLALLSIEIDLQPTGPLTINRACVVVGGGSILLL